MDCVMVRFLAEVQLLHDTVTLGQDAAVCEPPYVTLMASPATFFMALGHHEVRRRGLVMHNWLTPCH